MTIHNLSVHKIAKVVIKETPEVIKILDDTYKKLERFSVLREVRLLMGQITETKTQLKLDLANAEKIVYNKSRTDK